MDDASKNATRILYRFVTDKDSRLQYGSKLRAEMHEAIKRGEEPQGYRIEWIKSCVKDIFQLLGNKAAEFNVLYPQDRISNMDMHDVLVTAVAKLRNSGKQK